MRRDFAFHQTLNPLFPCFIKSDSIDALQDVDSCRRLADLETGSLFVTEIRGSKFLQRCAVGSESLIDCPAVFFICENEYIQIFRCSRFSMNANRIAANHKSI